jgi:hypothetical protein
LCLISYPYMVPFHTVVVFGSEHDFLFKSDSTYCVTMIFVSFINEMVITWISGSLSCCGWGYIVDHDSIWTTLCTATIMGTASGRWRSSCRACAWGGSGIGVVVGILILFNDSNISIFSHYFVIKSLTTNWLVLT